MKTANPLGCIDAVQVAKSIDELREIDNRFDSFRYVHPKTVRRFYRKLSARLAELRPKNNSK